jgi:hypothetical protein
VVFTLWFSTLQRRSRVPANFNASVNVELAVGALEETVTVSGDSPIVDIQSSQKTVSLKRRFSTRCRRRAPMQPGSLAVGVKVVAQNVSGAASPRSSGSTCGAAAADNTISVDGMAMNSTYSNGETNPNHNDSMTQEVTVQTASRALKPGGGLFINLIPKAETI